MLKKKLKKILTMVVAVAMAVQMAAVIPASAVSIVDGSAGKILLNEVSLASINSTFKASESAGETVAQSLELASKTGSFTVTFDYTVNTPMADSAGGKSKFDGNYLHFCTGDKVNGFLRSNTYNTADNSLGYVWSANSDTAELFRLTVGQKYNFTFEFKNIGVGTKGTAIAAGKEPSITIKVVDSEGKTVYEGTQTDLRNYSDYSNGGIASAIATLKLGVTTRAGETEPASVTFDNAKMFEAGPDDITVSTNGAVKIYDASAEEGYKEGTVTFDSNTTSVLYAGSTNTSIPLQAVVSLGADALAAYAGDVVYELQDAPKGIAITAGDAGTATLKVSSYVPEGEYSVVLKSYLKNYKENVAEMNFKIHKEPATVQTIMKSVMNELVVTDSKGTETSAGAQFNLDDEESNVADVTVGSESKPIKLVGDLTLPESGDGYTVKWEALDTNDKESEVISSTGKYSPVKGSDGIVKLVATVTSTKDTSVSVKKTFYLQVSNPSAEVENDRTWLIKYMNSEIDGDVTSDIDLPLEGQYGSTIVWTSSAPSIISTKGKVTRQNSNKTVSLTATIEKGSETAEETFEIVVKKKSSTGNGTGGTSGSSSHITGVGVITKPSATPVPTVAPTQAPAKQEFTDLGSVEWAKEAINALSERSVVNGKTATEFAPNDDITRAEFAKILINAFGLVTPNSTVTALSDVTDSSAWYYEAIASAYNKGIITGYSDGSFGINDKVTREDMAVMVYRAAQYAKVNINVMKPETNFADANEISDYAVEAVNALQRAGVINGVSDTEFAPKATATRAQAAKMVYGLTK